MTLYVIEDGQGRVKVGITRDVIIRMRNLQTGDADAHSLRLAVNVQGFEVLLERSFHDAFAQRRCVGGCEWYWDGPEIRAWCYALLAGRQLAPGPYE